MCQAAGRFAVALRSQPALTLRGGPVPSRGASPGLERGSLVDYDEALARRVHQQPGAARLLAEATARFRDLGMREWSRRAALLEVIDR